jgi:GAF domain-containing protein
MSDRIEKDSMFWLHQQQHRIINILLGFITVAGPLGLFIIIQHVLQGTATSASLFYLITYAMIVILFVVRKIPDSWRAIAFLLLLYGFALFMFLSRGLTGGGRPFLLALIAVSAVLLSPHASFMVAGLSAVTYVILGVAFALGWLIPPDSLDQVTTQVILLEGTGFIVVVGMVAISPWFFQQALEAAAQANKEAYETRVSLSERAEELESANTLLTQRAEMLATISNIAHNITSVLELQVLLNQVVAMLSDALGFYHVGIFLMGEQSEHLVLRAASSKGGQQMLEAGYRILLNDQAGTDFSQHLVTEAVLQDAYCVALDTGPDAVQFDNVNLPETHSELALPLRSRGKIIGVLDIQSSQSIVFSEQTVAALQVLAGLVGVAVGNAQLLKQVEATAEAERRARGALARAAWERVLREQPDLGFLSDPVGTSPVGNVWDEEMREAVLQGQPVSGATSEEEAALAVPIRSRGQVVGVIDAHLPSDAGQWTPEQVTLLEALSQQVGTALESAQLYRETQSRAVREQMTREITDKMRNTISWGELLQTAIQEMAAAVDAPRSFVQWVASETSNVGTEDSGGSDA